MSQIIFIHIGGAGVNLGLQFWKQFQQCKEQFNNKQSVFPYINRLYEQGQKKGQPDCPRAIFADSDIRSRESVLSSKLPFNSRSVLGNESSCENNYAVGRYHKSNQIKEQFVEQLRKKVQNCDRLSGFIFTSSPAGGSGSGIGSTLLCETWQSQGDKMVQDFKIMPGPQQNFSFRNLTPQQIYNIVLSTHNAIQNTDIIYNFQNTAAQRKLPPLIKTPHISYNDINKYYSQCLIEHISPYLQPGTINTNQRKRAVNLILFPRMKHICGILGQKNSKSCILDSLQDKNKLMIHQSPNDKLIFNLAMHIKDNFISQQQVNSIINLWSENTKNTFADWIPNKVSLSLRSKNAHSILPDNQSSWTLINGSNNIQWVNKISELFTAQFRRKAFIHPYIYAGMDEMQFTEAESNCNDLSSQYVPYGGDWIEDEENYQYQIERIQ